MAFESHSDNATKPDYFVEQWGCTTVEKSQVLKSRIQGVMRELDGLARVRNSAGKAVQFDWGEGQGQYMASSVHKRWAGEESNPTS